MADRMTGLGALGQQLIRQPSRSMMVDTTTGEDANIFMDTDPMDEGRRMGPKASVKNRKPTRDMFDSEREYLIALYEYYQTSEGKKEDARMRLANFEAMVDTAKDGGMKADRAFDNFRQGVEMTTDTYSGVRDPGWVENTRQELKDAYEWSPSAGPDRYSERMYEIMPEYANMNQGGRVGLYAGGEPEEGIGSLDAGAPDITYEGNEGPQAPQQMADALLREEYDKYVYDLLEQRPDATPMSFEEFRQMVLAEGQMSGGQPLQQDPTKPVNPWTPKPTGPALPDKMMASQGGRIKYNQGGRTGFQTGGVTESRVLPQEWVEALGKTYAADLTKQAGIPSITTAVAQQPGETAQQWQQRQAQAQQYGITKAGMADLAPQVAAQDAYQTAAYTQAVDPTTGLGAYQPFLTKAGTAADAATALTGTGAGTGAGSIQSYMSPYQQQVIDATMADYDAQAAKSRLGLGAQAVGGGAFGSGRHGIAEAEFDALSNRGRAAQLANLRSTGFQQAAQRRQQDLANQMGISNLQQGLGGQAQDFSRAQIAGLGTLGATQQAQNQAVLDAQRQFATMAVQEPVNRMNMLGTGVIGVMGGMSPYRTEIGEVPASAQSSPLATALGVGLAGADIYSRLLAGKKSS